MSENTFIIIDFPFNLLKFELKEYLEYNFKVYIKKEESDIVVFGNFNDLSLCQEQANYFKSVDSQFLLHLNEYANEALNISNLKLFLQSKCKILMRIEANILYIFGQLYNTTCVYNYLCHYINLIERDMDFDFSDSKETDLNLMCRELDIKMPTRILTKTKILIFLILKHRLELFTQLDTQKEIDFDELPMKLENVNITMKPVNKETKLETRKPVFTSDNDASYLLQLNQDTSQKVRTVIIDGNNVAYEHGLGNFSPMGIKIAVDYFISRGHEKVFAVVPRHFQPLGGAVFEQLGFDGNLKYTPSRMINKVRETPHTDRFILDAAVATDGIVVSNDQFREQMSVEKYQHVICNRLIAFTFVDDHIIIPNDPLGRNGPCLNDILSFPERNWKSPKKPQQHQFKRPRQVPAYSKTMGFSSFHSHKPMKSDLKGPQVELYRRVHDILPDDGSWIKSVILSNPEVTDLNTIINIVMMAKKSK